MANFTYFISVILAHLHKVKSVFFFSFLVCLLSHSYWTRTTLGENHINAQIIMSTFGWDSPIKCFDSALFHIYQCHLHFHWVLWRQHIQPLNNITSHPHFLEEYFRYFPALTKFWFFYGGAACLGLLSVLALCSEFLDVDRILSTSLLLPSLCLNYCSLCYLSTDSCLLVIDLHFEDFNLCLIFLLINSKEL